MSSSTLPQIRAALVAMVRSVPDIGVVHDRERYVKNEAAFKALYVPIGIVPAQLRGWWVRRVATTRRAVNMARVLTAHEWQIRGYMALNDESGSELIFDDLIEAVADKVKADPTLGGVTDPCPLNRSDNQEGVQVSDCGPVMFCGVLCHSAVLELRTWSYS